MKKIVWKQTMLAMGLMVPATAMAMGLGAMQVTSSPGEPFTASIPILSANHQNVERLHAYMADGATFKIAGIPKNANLDQWHVAVVRSGSPHIVIRSPVPLIHEKVPFIIEVKWPSGQMSREYTGSGEASTSAHSLMASIPAVTGGHHNEFSGSVPSVSNTLFHGWANVERYGPVRIGATLLGIAQDINQLGSITTDQVMSALVRANPDAFQNGNPSVLYAGTYLSLPDVQDVRSVSPTQARQWFIQQTMLTRTISKVGVSHTPPATPVVSVARPAVHPAKSSGVATHLVLSSAPPAHPLTPVKSSSTALPVSKVVKTGAAAPSVAATASTESTSAALRNQEEKLRGTVKDLRTRLADVLKAVDIQNGTMTAISRKIAYKQHVDEEILAASAAGNILLLALLVWVASKRRATKKGKDAVQSTEYTPRKKSVPDDTQASKNQQASMETPNVVTDGGAVVPTFDGTAHSPVQDATVGGATLSESGVSDVAMVDAPEVGTDSYTDVSAAETDPIEQAELYMVYGKTDLAVSTLKKALDIHPEHAELYSALLDVYTRMDSMDEYLDLARSMRDYFGGNSRVWQEVASKGAELFPANPLFISSPESATSTESVVADTRMPDDVMDAIDEQFRQLTELPIAEPQKDFVDTVATTDVAQESPPSSLTGLELITRGDDTPSKVDHSVSDAVEHDQHAEWDEMGTKLDLAKAYTEMGDTESAKDLIEEVLRNGDEAQKLEAQHIKSSVS